MKWSVVVQLNQIIQSNTNRINHTIDCALFILYTFAWIILNVCCFYCFAANPGLIAVTVYVWVYERTSEWVSEKSNDGIQCTDGIGQFIRLIFKSKNAFAVRILFKYFFKSKIISRLLLSFCSKILNHHFKNHIESKAVELNAPIHLANVKNN